MKSKTMVLLMACAAVLMAGCEKSMKVVLPPPALKEVERMQEALLLETPDETVRELLVMATVIVDWEKSGGVIILRDRKGIETTGFVQLIKQARKKRK